MRALCTGGCGLVGSHIVDLLLARGDDVVILDNLEPVTHPSGMPAWTKAQRGVSVVMGDIRDYGMLLGVMHGVDVVFHQAAFGGFSPDPRKMVEVNTLGTVNVLTAAAHAGVSKAVVASSQAVYGKDKERTAWDFEHRAWEGERESYPFAETDECYPESPYAISKYAAERLTLFGGWPFPVVALRYALTFGPRQSASNPYTGVTSLFSNRILHGLPPVIFEDGLQTRDFTYVEDVASANLHVAYEPRADGNVYNVGTGVATTVLNFARTLCRAYGTDIEPVLSGEYRPQDARHVITDPSRLRALGWEPQVSVSEGVRRFADWFAAQPERPVVDASDELRSVGVIR